MQTAIIDMKASPLSAFAADLKLLRTAVLFSEKVFYYTGDSIMEEAAIMKTMNVKQKLLFLKTKIPIFGNSYKEERYDEQLKHYYFGHITRHNKSVKELVAERANRQYFEVIEQAYTGYVKDVCQVPYYKEIADLNDSSTIKPVIFGSTIPENLIPGRNRTSLIELLINICHGKVIPMLNASVMSSPAFAGEIALDCYDGKFRISNDELFSLPNPWMLYSEEIRIIRQEFVSKFGWLPLPESIVNTGGQINHDKENNDGLYRYYINNCREQSELIQDMLDNNTTLSKYRYTADTDHVCKIYQGICTADILIRLYIESGSIDRALGACVKEKLYSEGSLGKCFVVLVLV